MSGNTLTLRAAEPSDRDALDRLFGQSYPVLLKPDYPPSILVTAVPLISQAQPALIASGTFYVMCDGPEIVGAGGWTMQAPGGKPGVRIGHIRHVVTDHRRTREGIAQIVGAHHLARPCVRHVPIAVPKHPHSRFVLRSDGF